MQNANVTKKWKNKRKEKKMKEKGITLIALVITIIVLLILAAVSIATLTGENGILTKANKAKEKTETASKEEQRKLAVMEANMSDTETTFQGVKIPAGFAPTKIEGESTIDEGLVIVDGEGNSYVWIEVPKTEEVYTTATTTLESVLDDNCPNIEQDLQNYASNYRDSNYKDEWKSEEQSGLKQEKYTELKNKMLKSVYENGGFWVGQYEMGTEILRTKKDDELTNPVCKEGAYPYNFVTCKQAQQLAREMKSGDYESSLMFGIQWDLVMKFIETKEGKTQNELKKDSKEWGNYVNASFNVTKGEYSMDEGQNFTAVTEETEQPVKPENTKVLLTTGASERNSVLNIYDIAGNVIEWTSEQYNANSNEPCCLRGGDCGNGGINFPVSNRGWR